MDIVNLPAGPASVSPNPGKANAQGDSASGSASGFKDAMHVAHDNQRPPQTAERTREQGAQSAPDHAGQNSKPTAQSKPAGRPAAHGRDDKPGDARRDKKIDHGDRRDEGIAYPDPLLAGLTHVGTLVASDPANAGITASGATTSGIAAVGMAGVQALLRTTTAGVASGTQTPATPTQAAGRGRGLQFAQALQSANGPPAPDAGANTVNQTFILGKLGTADQEGAANGQPKLARLRATAEAAAAKTDTVAANDTSTRHASAGKDRAATLPMSGDATQFFNSLASVHGDTGTAIPSLHGFTQAGAAASNQSGASSALPTLALLQAPVGSAPWQQELSAQVLRFAQQGTQRIELHLHPRELGPLQISLQVHDHQAQAQFIALHAEVRDAVQQALPQLREALAQQGIALGEAMVGQQQQSSQQDGNPSSERSPRAARAGDTQAIAGITPPLATARSAPLPLGAVDTYA